MGRAKRGALAAALLGVALGVLVPASAGLAASQVEAHVPEASAFDAVIKRDLTAYFANLASPPVEVTYEFLRQVPTQSGVAYPKYYLWVVVKAGGKPFVEGALRAMAMDRTDFRVTDFLSQACIVKNPDTLAWIFPAALKEAIVLRAKAPETTGQPLR